MYVGVGIEACQEKGLHDWCICDVIGWSCGRLERAKRRVTTGGDYGSVIVRVVPTDCYMGGRCLCGSGELTWVRI